MAWFAELAGKAENLLINLDEQTGAALRNHTAKNKKHDCVPTESPFIQAPRKRPPRNTKKSGLVNSNDPKPNYATSNVILPARKTSPTGFNQIRQTHQSHAKIVEENNGLRQRTRKSPASRQLSLNPVQYQDSLHYDVPNNQYSVENHGVKHRRYSLPADLEIINDENLAYSLQNLEVENTMLKNELNVVNKEVSELLSRLRKTEDGNDVVRNCEELNEAKNQLEVSELASLKSNLDNDSLTSQIVQLKAKIKDVIVAESHMKDTNGAMQIEIDSLQQRNKEIEDKILEMNSKLKEKESANSKLEAELRHAQSTIYELQENLEKSNAECLRLERDWETYKLRVKNMLFAKDSEIKSLQNGISLNEDTKVLMQQINTLKEERERLSDVVVMMKSECQDIRTNMSELESRNIAAEKVVKALRDAMKEERAARSKAEAQCVALAKELKKHELESGQTIANLRMALNEKESELNNFREATSSMRMSDTSTLNVADCEVTRDSIENEKIQYLTETLVQRQARIESLMADNNMLRIQMEKLESKYKNEIATLRTRDSIVNVNDGECRARSRTRYAYDSTLAVLSMRLGVFIRRNPIFRVFIFIYMIGLHLWVLTVLLTNTPDTFAGRSSSS